MFVLLLLPREHYRVFFTIHRYEAEVDNQIMKITLEMEKDETYKKL